ncbi:MAG: sulfate ABC transporter permease subunit CysT [Clostridia bacterium]|nr:sulfate ABC transporter permease subunit CysT [Clostridia bacterium]
MRTKNKRVIPGFGLSMGVTVTIMSIIVLIPLASLVIYTAKMDFNDIISTITNPRTLASFRVSFLTSLAASVINTVMGVILAWVLVRYKFPGRRILDGMIELPFALPTAVAGLALSNLTTEDGIIGRLFAPFGIKLAYTTTGITIALIFIGIPFVVRAVQPVLEKLDSSYEEAAGALGANNWTTVRRVILPEILPAALTGFGLALGRCIGEYGSVIFIAGNKPYETEIAPLRIMSELQEFDYAAATSIALVMLAIAFVILSINAVLQSKVSRRISGLA